jgi:hypothetical protein
MNEVGETRRWRCGHQPGFASWLRRLTFSNCQMVLSHSGAPRQPANVLGNVNAMSSVHFPRNILDFLLAIRRRKNHTPRVLRSKAAIPAKKNRRKYCLVQKL